MNAEVPAVRLSHFSNLTPRSTTLFSAPASTYQHPHLQACKYRNLCYDKPGTDQRCERPRECNEEKACSSSGYGGDWRAWWARPAVARRPVDLDAAPPPPEAMTIAGIIFTVACAHSAYNMTAKCKIAPLNPFRPTGESRWSNVQMQPPDDFPLASRDGMFELRSPCARQPHSEACMRFGTHYMRCLRNGAMVSRSTRRALRDGLACRRRRRTRLVPCVSEI